MKKFNVKISEVAAQCVTSGTVFRRTTTELYDLYSHPEDMSLFIQIVGDDSKDIPSVYIDDVTLETLRYTLSQLSTAALNHSLIWPRAYNGEVLQEFAVGCDPQYKDFEVNGCSFRLYPFTKWSSDYLTSSLNTLICHEDEATEMLDNIKNIINNR